jgi:hypothetical protein
VKRAPSNELRQLLWKGKRLEQLILPIEFLPLSKEDNPLKPIKECGHNKGKVKKAITAETTFQRPELNNSRAMSDGTSRKYNNEMDHKVKGNRY